MILELQVIIFVFINKDVLQIQPDIDITCLQNIIFISCWSGVPVEPNNLTDNENIVSQQRDKEPQTATPSGNI